MTKVKATENINMVKVNDVYKYGWYEKKIG